MRTFIAAAMLMAVSVAHGQEAPKVYLAAQSSGNVWTAVRDQTQEMAKDFAKDCPKVRVTVSQEQADYELALSHIELGLINRMNQIRVSDALGNVLTAKDVRSINGGMKQACSLILEDWSKQSDTRSKLVNAINGSFQKRGVLGYAEITGDQLTVHSEHADAMRFHMALADSRHLSYVRRAGILTYVYTNDADKNFVYDVRSGHIVSPSKPAPSQTSAEGVPTAESRPQ